MERERLRAIRAANRKTAAELEAEAKALAARARALRRAASTLKGSKTRRKAA